MTLCGSADGQSLRPKSRLSQNHLQVTNSQVRVRRYPLGKGLMASAIPPEKTKHIYYLGHPGEDSKPRDALCSWAPSGTSLPTGEVALLCAKMRSLGLRLGFLVQSRRQN